MARHETIGHYAATERAENVKAHIEPWRQQALRDLSAARDTVKALKRAREALPEDAGRVLFELRAAAIAVVDEIDRL